MSEPRKGAEVRYTALRAGKTYIINTAPGVWYKGTARYVLPRVVMYNRIPWDDERGEWQEGRMNPENKYFPAEDDRLHFYNLPGQGGPVPEASVEGAEGGKRRRHRKSTRKGSRKSRRATRRNRFT